jgi:hypothetical protein
MSDRIFFALAIAVAAGVISLALQWPQGLGARAWGPFGRETFAEQADRTKAPPAASTTADAVVNAAQAQLKGGL